MAELSKVRCSRLPLALTCAQSLRGDIAVEGDDGLARLGTAFHEYMAAHVLDREIDIPDLASAHGVDLDDLAVLCAFGRRAWDALVEHFPDAQTEVSLSHIDPVSGLTLTGKADLLSIVEE